MSAGEINVITISGGVRRPKCFDAKLVFILNAPSGNFYVEYWGDDLALVEHQQVMVCGSVYTVRDENGDRARIRARIVYAI